MRLLTASQGVSQSRILDRYIGAEQPGIIGGLRIWVEWNLNQSRNGINSLGEHPVVQLRLIVPLMDLPEGDNSRVLAELIKLARDMVVRRFQQQRRTRPDR